MNEMVNNKKNIILVSELNLYIRELFEFDWNLNNILIRGEISNFKNHYQSGHLYFSLKEKSSVVKAVMFSWCAKRLKFGLQDGMKVILKGSVSVYEASGQYQIYVEDIQPDGFGSVFLAFEQLKQKLETEGLFDIQKKKQIPKYPQKLGVITSETGAVIHDIQNVLARRYPLCEIVLYPVQVQGDTAPRQIVKALKFMNTLDDIDILIVGRGGGSIEELWAFNDEDVARTIAMSRIPVISAVGHETDFTICDFVADLRAPTPSAAAELATPNKDELLSMLDAHKQRLAMAMTACLNDYNTKIECLTNKFERFSPKYLLSEYNLQLETLKNCINTATSNKLTELKNKLSIFESKIKAMNPRKTLERGYSIVSINGKIISSIKDFTSSTFKITFYDGEVEVNAEQT